MNLQRLVFYSGATALLLMWTEIRAASPTPSPADVNIALNQLQSNALFDATGMELWDDFLLNKPLRDMLASGSEVNAKQLAKTIARYRLAERNASRSRFARLGKTLDDWLVQLTGVATSVADVVNAVAELEDWLGTSPTQGNRWMKYLRLHELHQQLSLGENADPKIVRNVLDRFESGKPGLKHQRFAKAQRPLRAWHGTLDGGTLVYKEVQSATEEVTEWISRGGKRRYFWSTILLLEDLQDQIKAAQDADPSIVALVRNRVLNESHIDHEVFRKTRRTLENWYADLRHPITSSLATVIRSRKRTYEPISPTALMEARNRLTMSLVRLDNYLASGGEKKQRGWKQFLQWDALQEQLQAENHPNLFQLASIYRKFSSGESGQANPPFVSAERNMKAYLENLRLAETSSGRVTSSRSDIDEPLRLLDRELAAGGVDYEAAWRKRLRWDLIQDVLTDDDPSFKLLAKLRQHLTTEHDTKTPVPSNLHRFATNFAKYAELIQLRDRQPRAEDLFAARMELLSQTVDNHEQNPTVDSAANVANQLNWLDMTMQAPDLIANIRRRYLNSNLIFNVKASVLQDRIDRKITNTSPVSEMMDRVRIEGTARTEAQLSARLLPSSDGAKLEIRLSGQSHSNTTGKVRRVSVCAQGLTQINGRQTILIRPAGLTAYQPAAHTSTTQRITSVDVNRQIGQCLATKIVRKQAIKSVPKGERIADQKAQQQLYLQMKEKSDILVDETNQKLMAKVVQPLKDNKLYPDEVSIQSTANDISLHALVHYGQFRLGAPTQPPRENYSSDIVAKLHETAVNNLLAAKFGGVKIDNDQVAEMMGKHNLQKAAPDSTVDSSKTKIAEQSGEADESWSIKFNRLQPASIRFKDDGLRIALRAEEFTREGNPERFRVELAATYSIVVHGVGQFELVRQGDPVVVFPGHTGKLSVEQLTLKTFILRKIEALYQPHFSIDDFPAGDFVDALKKMDVEHLKIASGWAMVGLTANSLPLEL